MDKRETKKLYKAAVQAWGVEAQLGMLMEECAELIQAANKVLRKGENSDWRHLAQEMADVEIMIEQLKTATDWQNLEQIAKTEKHDKLLRLKALLEGKK